MTISQNALFEGAPPVDDEFDHPPGCYIARVLGKALASSGWAPSEIDNWRDCGWSIECAQSSATLQIAFSQMEEGKWMLQVAPTYVPGLIGSLLKKQPSANSSQCLALAQAVHAILSSDDCLSGFKWCWDGNPGDQDSTDEPIAQKDS